MDQEAKRQIKKLVLDLRHLLEEDLTVVLKRYGIFTDRAWLKPEALPKATTELLATRQYLEAAMLPDLDRGLSQARAAALYVREAAFTHLNRLVGLKAIEVRGLFTETIQTRPEYGGRSLYHRDYRAGHPVQAAASDDALPAALLAACSDVARQIRFVFDPEAERSLLWPRYAAIKEAISLINALPIELWQADEIIGWLYQFYNAEEKKKIRKQGKPSLPIEVAVINQFFTPRWVVKFLVDNTLGRLWLEMHPESERVRAKCDYLVPEPASPDRSSVAKARPPKRPQDIRLIDPACGAMHFGHYAFEVFQEIYRDAREHGWVDKEDSLDEAQIPLAILKYNLFGVDIDLRAVQLAALALYLKARTALREAGVSDQAAGGLPWQVNLVCADARLTNGGLREKFLKNYADDPALQKAWRELFQEMEDIAQVGSLLRVEERFRQILSAARPHSVRGLDEPRQVALPGLPAPAHQMRLGESQEVSYWTPIRSLDQMLEELRCFAHQALEEHDVNAQIFAAEAEKTLGLLDVLMQSYDVVVMNPPYGHTTDKAKEYLEKIYPITKNDLFMVFVESGFHLLKNGGMIGSLVSKNFFTLERAGDFRKKVLFSQGNILAALDLGAGVLDDAAVDTAAFVFAVPRFKQNLTVFVDLIDNRDKQAGFEEFLRTGKSGYWCLQEDLEQLPGAALIYNLPPSVAGLFGKYPPLDLHSYQRVYGKTKWSSTESQFAHVRSGLVAPNYARFVKYFWEIPRSSIGVDWIRFSKGGDYQTYYADLEYVLWWKDSGKEAKEYSAIHYGSASRYIKNEKLFFKEGITYPRISSGLNARYLPKDNIFSEKGPVIFSNEQRIDLWYLLGFINSKLAAFLAKAIHPGRSYEVLHISTLPCVVPESTILSTVKNNAKEIWGIKQSWDTGNELSSIFTIPWLMQIMGDKFHLPVQLLEQNSTEKSQGSLPTLLNRAIKIEQAIDLHLRRLQNEIDQSVYQLYSIATIDQSFIESRLNKRPLEVIWSQMEGKSAAEKRCEHVRRLVSYFLRQALQADNDGLLPLTQVPGESTALDALRAQMEAFFGEERAFTLEGEISAELGKPLEKWLETDFIPWHTKLYKNRPIIWLLGSPGGTLRALADYHKLRRESLVSLRSMYLSRQRDSLRAGLARVAEVKEYKSAGPLEDALADLDVLDQAIDQVLNLGWSPDVDAGVKANILPLQGAGVVQYAIK